MENNNVTLVTERSLSDLSTHEHMNFDGDSFNGKVIMDRCFVQCVFKNCSFICCDFRHAQFDNCIFEYCDFNYSSFINTEFTESLLYRGIFKKAKFSTRGRIVDCRVMSCNFEESEGFNECSIHGSHFDSCSFPKDFDMRRFGEILEEDIIGWKKCTDMNFLTPCVVKLLIPKGSVVFSINGKK